ncbi:MAG: hypothetical protein A2057_00455 [Ignavibacteria bacterium GWA2_35_9]|nr:MAG: hypothetical protein A2057_00455 [Ignavibacteria bacterium GWA2_35_9]
MSKLLKFCVLLLFVFSSFTIAQFNGNRFSVGLNGVYTTTARVYLNPNSSDVTLRNQYFLLEDILNPALDIRYRLADLLIIGLNIEKMKKTGAGPNLRVLLGTSVAIINIEDGFNLIPVELTLYYILPFSTEKFKFLMGGGGGYYIGEHIRKFGDADIENVERKAAYGIQVSISMEYLIKTNVAIRTEMKFRDPQFNLKSRYTKDTINYQGSAVRLSQELFDSKINVDGVTFVVGAAINF